MPIEIKPEKLKEIAEYLDAGMACFYNKTNGELETYPYGLEDSGLEEEWADVTGKIKSFPDYYLQIERMSKREAFELMKNFIDEIDHVTTRSKFIGAISRKKPFQQFNNLLSDYPDLREQWFAFKLKHNIEHVKSQVEIRNKLDDPIKGFYIQLEYHLTGVFQHFQDQEIRTMWCDGVFVPADSPLSIQTAIKTKEIETQAVIGWVGDTRQEKYEMIIKLGPNAIKKYRDGLSMVGCLPSVNSLSWILLDMENNKIELQLQ